LFQGKWLFSKLHKLQPPVQARDKLEVVFYSAVFEVC
jgi:hypothetical protein